MLMGDSRLPFLMPARLVPSSLYAQLLTAHPRGPAMLPFSLRSSAPARPVGLHVVALESRQVPATVTATDDVDDYNPDRPTDWDGDNDQLSLPEAIRQVNKAGGSIDFAVDQVTISTTGLPAI